MRRFGGNHVLAFRRRGTTLLELMVVVVILGIVTVSVIPAFASMSDARKLAGAQEAERLLLGARASAVAQGRPFGVAIDVSGQTLQTVYIAAAGQAPAPAPSQDGQGQEVLEIGRRFPGAELSSLSDGAGNPVSGSATLWFGYDGTPQRRDNAGTLIGGWTSDAVLEFVGPSTVTVRRQSGAIDRS